MYLLSTACTYVIVFIRCWLLEANQQSRLEPVQSIPSRVGKRLNTVGCVMFIMQVASVGGMRVPAPKRWLAGSLFRPLATGLFTRVAKPTLTLPPLNHLSSAHPATCFTYWPSLYSLRFLIPFASGLQLTTHLFSGRRCLGLCWAYKLTESHPRRSVRSFCQLIGAVPVRLPSLSAQPPSHPPTSRP